MKFSIKKMYVLYVLIFNISILKIYSQSLCPINTNISPSTPICSGASATLNVSQVTSSLPSNALSFNGSSSYAYTANFIASLPTAAVTIELWVKAASAGVIVDELGGAASWHNSQIEILSTGEIKVAVLNLPSVSIGTVAFNTWNHVVLRYNNITSALDGFLNGVISSTSATGSRDRSGAAYYAFGKSDATNLGSGAWLNGSIDEVRIWDVARTASQIAANYNQTIPVNSSGLAAYYQFNETSGLISADGTINARTLNLISSPTWQVPSTAPVWSSSIGSNYTWSTGATTSSIVVTPTVTTAYTIVGTSTAGCVASNVIVVTVNPTPIILVNSGSICTGNSFIMTPTGANTYTYSSGSSIVNPLTNSTYTVTGSSVAGCTNSAVSSVTVNLSPTVSVNSGSICSGTSFIMTPSGAATYVYSSGSASVAPTQNSTFTVTGTSATGCSNSAVSNVTVNPYPLLTISGTSVICQGSTTTLSAVSSTLTGPSNAIVLDGVDDYLTNNLSGTTLSEFTIEAFITPDALPQASKGIIQWATNINDPAPMVLFQQNSSALNIYVNTGYNLTVPLVLNAWNHVALTYSSSVYKLYLNGSLVGTYNGGLSNQGNASKIFLGNGYIGFWKGNMDEVRVWSVARTQPQIASNYSVSVGSSSPGLTAYYQFNEFSGITSINNATSVNTLTLSNGPTWQIPSTAPVLSNTVSASSYAWSTGSTSPSIIISPSISTTYSLVGSSSSGCAGIPIVYSVTVNSTPPVAVNSGSICDGSSFTMIPSGASTYVYSSGSALVNPTTNTNYTVTGTNTLGCSNTAVSSVTVNANPTVSVNSGSICNGSSFTMIPSGALSYIYSGGLSTVSPSATTTFSVTGTNAAGCSNTAISNVTVNAIPAVTINSGSICIGKSFTMTPTGATTYVFTGGSAIVSPSSTTTYTVTGTSSGCSNTAVASVTVNANPTISVNSGSICNGSSFIMNPTGAASYVYTGGSATVSPTTNTNYTVTGTSALGCTNTAVSNVTVNATPVLSVNSGSLCSGNNFTFTPTGAISYTYSSGSAIVTPSATTTYTVSGSNAFGCTSSSVKTITVGATPVINVSSGAVCTGGSWTITPAGAATYTYSSGSAVVTPTITTSYTVSGASTVGCQSNAVITVSVNPTLLFSPNSGSVCIGSTFTMSPTGAASYTYSSGTALVTPTTTTTYTIIAINSVGCLGLDYCTVTVNALPTLTVNSGAICVGQSFTIVPTGASTYTYSSGSDVVNPLATTDYSVTGTDANGCVTATDAISSVTVNALPTVTAVSDFTTICTGEVATLTAGGATSYVWDIGATTATTATTPTTTTTYSVNGMDANGCVNTANVTVNVNACVGIQQLSSAQFNVNVYPNPTAGLVTIVLNATTQVTITNALGQVVFAETVLAGKQTLDLKNQTNGLYFMNLKQDGKQQTIKVIKN